MELFNAIAAAALIGLSFTCTEKANASGFITHCIQTVRGQSLSESRARVICQSFNRYQQSNQVYDNVSRVWRGANAMQKLGINPANTYQKACNKVISDKHLDKYYCNPSGRKYANTAPRPTVANLSRLLNTIVLHPKLKQQINIVLEAQIVNMLSSRGQTDAHLAQVITKLEWVD